MSTRPYIAALTATFAMGASVAQAEEIPGIPWEDVSAGDISSILNKTEITHPNGKKIKIIFMHNELHDEWRVARPTGANAPYDLVGPLYNYLRNNGFNDNPKEWAKNIAWQYNPNGGNGYRPHNSYPVQRERDHGNSQTSRFKGPAIFMVEPEQDDLSKVLLEPSEQCVAVRLSVSHSGEQWIRSWLHMEDSSRHISSLPDYRSEFRDFVLFHELGHCMGATEILADYVAAKMMLHGTKNKTKTLEFLKLMSGIRTIEALQPRADDKETGNADRKYTGNFVAISRAMEEFKQSGNKVHETVEQIWLMAMTPTNFNAWQVPMLGNYMMKHQWENFITRDYAPIADFLIDTADVHQDQRISELAVQAAHGLSAVGRIVAPPDYTYPRPPSITTGIPKP